MRSSVDSCCGTSGALDIAKSLFDRTSPSIWRSGLVTLIPRMRAKAWSIWWFYAKSCARQMSYRQCLSGIGKLSVHAKDFKETSKEEKTTPQPWQEQEPRESCATGLNSAFVKEKKKMHWNGWGIANQMRDLWNSSSILSRILLVRGRDRNWKELTARLRPRKRNIVFQSPEGWAMWMKMLGSHGARLWKRPFSSLGSVRSFSSFSVVPNWYLDPV